MYEDFPYTNLHQLNLDWLVDVVQTLHDNMVISVNGQTGEVILYKDATVQLPNVDDRAWTILRNAHGVKRGIKFDQDGNTYIVSGNSLASVFTPDNPPASSQVTYDQYVRLTTLTGEQLHNWNIFRTLNNQSTGIEFDDTGEAYIISGSNRYRLYSTKNPIGGDVSSVNGQTGDVVLYTDSNGEMTLPQVTNPNIDAWSIGRTINGTACRIYIYDDGQVTITAGNDEYRLVNSDELSDLEDEVTDLKSAIGLVDVTLSPTDSEPYAGYWYVNNGVVSLQPSSTYYTLEHPIDVSQYVGKKASITSTFTGVYGVKIFDANNNALRVINGNTASDEGYTITTNPQTIEVVIPNNAKYITADIRKTKYTGMSQFAVTVSYSNFVELIEDVAELDQRVDTLEAGVKTYTIVPTFTDNSYIDINNNVQANGRYAVTEYINIKPYKQITFPTNNLTSSTAVVFVNDDRTEIVAIYTGETLTGATATLLVPDGAGWFRATQRNTKLEGYTVTCEMYYYDKLKEIASAETPQTENPLDEIIHDGGFCKIFEKIGVVGDSLSSGGMTLPDADVTEEETAEVNTDMIYYSWIQYMARYSGLTAYNFSMSGLSARGLRFAQSNPNVQDIITRLMGTDYKCKAYFVALGHNDYNYTNTHPEYIIGTTADCNLANPSNNADSFCGNYAWVISQIKTVQPRAKIFLVGMKSANTFGAYNTAVASMVSLFNTYYNNTDVYYLDMSQYAPPLDASWEYTNGHGNAMGYLNYSYHVSSYVDYIIRHNKADFKLVQFIGTPYVQ